MHVGGHGHPSARRSQTETEAEPEVAQPREALHVWIDDEGQDRQPGHHQRHPVQQAGTDEEHCEEDGRQDPRCLHAHAARGQVTVLRSWVGGVDVTVNDAVQGHRKATRTNRGEEDPHEVKAGLKLELVEGQHVPHEHKGQREEGVLHLYEFEHASNVDVRPLRPGNEGVGAMNSPPIPGGLRPFPRSRGCAA